MSNSRHRETVFGPLFLSLVAGGLLTISTSTGAQAVAPTRVCQPNDFWAVCAKKVKAAIRATNDPAVALAAASEWADRYDRLYEANQQNAWSISDQRLLEEATSRLWDEAIGKYLDPPTLALGLALKRYFSKLAAALEFASGPQVTFFLAWLAPSPIANSFTEAKPDNAEINRLLQSKLPPLGTTTIRQRYPELFRQALTSVKGVSTGVP